MKKKPVFFLLVIMFVCALAAGHALAAQSDLYGDWAMLYLANGMYDQAMSTLQKAVTANPGDPDNYLALGMVATSQGKYDQAIKTYQTLLTQKGDFGFVWGLLGDALLGRGEIDRARAAFEKCLAIDSSSVSAWSGIGQVAWRSGKLDDAGKDFAHAVELAPDRAEGYLDLAGVYADLGNSTEAIATLKKGIAKAPGEPELAYELGRLLERASQPDEARNYYRMALRWDDQYAPARQALERLGAVWSRPAAAA